MMKNLEVLEEIRKQGKNLIETKRDEFVKQNLLSDEFIQMMQKNKKPFELLMSYYQCAIMEIETKFRVLKPGGTLLICNESNGDTDKDERWTEIIGGMTIYKDIELKAYLEQAGFHEVQIHKKKSWLCITARK